MINRLRLCLRGMISTLLTVTMVIGMIPIVELVNDSGMKEVKAASIVSNSDTKGRYTYTADKYGYYYIEAWGAAGGGAFKNDIGNHGNGGYASGVVVMQPGDSLTYYVGEQGKINGGRTFGGGGSANGGGGAGGGASGVIWGNSSYGNVIDEAIHNEGNLLIMAGGGGGTSLNLGAPEYNGIKYVYDGSVMIGNGGGERIGHDLMTKIRDIRGIWQDIYYNGVAEVATTKGTNNDASNGRGAGGGGYNNGNAGTQASVDGLLAGGAGGTGFLNRTRVIGIDGYKLRMLTGRSIPSRFADGGVRITYIGAYKVKVTILLNNLGQFNGSGIKASHEVLADCGSTINFPNVTPINSNVVFTGYTVVSGPISTSGGTRWVGMTDSVVQCNYTSNGINVVESQPTSTSVSYAWSDYGAAVYKVFTGVDVSAEATTAADWDNSFKDHILGVSDYYKNINWTTISTTGLYEVQLAGAQGGGSWGGYRDLKYGQPGSVNRAIMYLKSGDVLSTETYAGGNGASTRGHGSGVGGKGIGLRINGNVMMSAGGGTGCATAVMSNGGDEWGPPGVYPRENFKSYGHNGDNGAVYVIRFTGRDDDGNSVVYDDCRGASGGGGGGHNGGSGGGGQQFPDNSDRDWGNFNGSWGASFVNTGINGMASGNDMNLYPISNWVEAQYRPTDLGLIVGHGDNTWDGYLKHLVGNYNQEWPASEWAQYKLVGLMGFTKNTSGTYQLYDKQPPYSPKATDNGGYELNKQTGNFTVSWTPVEDKGSSNIFRVQSFTLSNVDTPYHEAVKSKTYTSGLRTYKYIIDNNPGTVVTNTCPNETPGTQIEVPPTANNQYIHIAAVDYSGNISETLTIRIPAEKVINYNNNNGQRVNIYGDAISTDATGFIESQSIMIRDTVTIASDINVYNRTGYWHKVDTYQVWNTKPDGTGQTYYAGQQVHYDSLPASLTLYAIWEPIVYDVRVITNVPADSTNNIVMKQTGWASNGDTILAKPETAGIGIGSDGYAKVGTGRTEQTDLYAMEFRYDRSGLKVPASNLVFSLKGWHTDGLWYKTGSESGDATTPLTTWTNPAYNLTTLYKEPQSGYPKWIKNTYTIHYNGNNTTKDIYNEDVENWNTAGGFTGTIADTVCSYDTNVTLSDGSGLKKLGYLFKGWSLKSDLSGYATTVDGKVQNTASIGTNVTDVIYSPGATLYKPNFTDIDGGEITLYAIWEPIRYDVAYDPWHGTTHKNHAGLGCTTGTADYHAEYRMKTYEQVKGEKVRYNQWFNLSENEYIRKYYVTLRDAEPWKLELKSQNGSMNSASRWVNYEFTGWTQDRQVGTTPYFEGTVSDRQFTDKQRVRNLTATHMSTVTMYAVWKSATIDMPSAVAGGDRWEFVNWSHKAYPDSRVHGVITEDAQYNVTKYDKVIADNSGKNTDDVGYTVNKGTAYKPYKDITLYAHWWRELTLSMDLQGGLYRDRIVKQGTGANATYVPENVLELKGVQYDYEDGYTFNILDGHTAQVNGKYDKQTQKPVHAYGAFDTNGINNYFRKYIAPNGAGAPDVDGKQYRLLGWQDATGKDVVSPDGIYRPKSDMSVYNGSHRGTYTIKDNTTIYAVWEPVLQVSLTFDGTIGPNEADSKKIVIRDGENVTTRDPKTTAMNMTAVSPSYVEAVIRPGEQGYYDIKTNNDNVNILTTFDVKMTDMYDQLGKWNDELNTPVQSEVNEYIDGVNQKHSLNRKFITTGQVTRKLFHIPRYLGTTDSYIGNEGVTKYKVNWVMAQRSYYWQDVKGEQCEKIIVPGTIYIGEVNGTGGGNGDTPWIDPGDGSSGDDHVDPIVNELRTKIKIREAN